MLLEESNQVSPSSRGHGIFSCRNLTSIARIGWWKAWFSLTPSLILDGSCARVSFCSWTRSICSDKSCRALLWAIISQTIQVEMMLIEPRNICYGDSTKLTEHTWTYIHSKETSFLQSKLMRHVLSSDYSSSLTQATDTTNIRLVFAAVKETILQNALKDSGIL